MKMHRFGLIAAMALGLALSGTTGSAQDAKDKGGQGGRRMPSVQERLDRMTEELKLTEEQKPKVKAVLEESYKKRQEIFADANVPREQRREKMQAIMDEQNKKFKEILTPDQYGKWEKMRESARPGRGPEGAPGKKKEEGTKSE